MHDGNSVELEDAIRRHRGEAAHVTDHFANFVARAQCVAQQFRVLFSLGNSALKAKVRAGLRQAGLRQTYPARCVLYRLECRKDHVSEEKSKYPRPYSHEPEVCGIHGLN